MDMSTETDIISLLGFKDADLSTQQGLGESLSLSPPSASVFQDLGLTYEDFALLDNLDDGTPIQQDRTKLTTSSPNGEDSTLSVSNNFGQQQPRPKRKRRVRATPKQEVDSLRGTVEELTATLQALETSKLQQKAEEQSTRSAARETMWMKMAERQLEMRKKAEQDNSTLRMMLKLQVQEAKSLKRMLKRRARIEKLEVLTGVKKLKRLTDDDTDDDIYALQSMLGKTDDLYVQIDTVFKQKNMDAVACPGKRKLTNRHASNDAFLEISEKLQLPFDMKATERAVWAALQSMGMQGLQCIKDFDAQVQFHAQHQQETNDTMMISHLIATSGFADVLTYLNRKVARKYVEQDRTVFICMKSSQPTLDTPHFRSVSCTHQIVVRSVGEDISLVESYYSVSSHVPAKHKLVMPMEMDIAIAVWSEMMELFTESVESYLLDDSRDALNWCGDHFSSE